MKANGKLIVQTPRLQLREVVVDDAAAFFAVNSDPDVMRYTGEEAPSSVDEMRRAIEAYPDYAQYGYGRWGLWFEERLIGFCGPKYLEEFGEADIGYRLLPEYWGRGIATEACRATCRYCADTLELNYLMGLVLEENPASIRVLEKCGFAFEGTTTTDGYNALRYGLAL